MSINPIETRYAGCRFRSRLEARWAVFFDTLGIRWQYEPQGYVVNGRPYLPDFLLPDLNASVEVKGDPERLDIPMLANAIGRDWTFTLILGPIPTMETFKVPMHSMLMPAVDVRESPQTIEIINEFCAALETITDADAKAAIERMVKSHRSTTITMSQVVFVATSEGGGFLPLWPMPFRSAPKVLEPGTTWPIVPLPKVQAAYKAARSARFEHGEKP